MERFLDTKLMPPREQVVKVIDRIVAEFRKGYKAIIMENLGSVLGGSEYI